MIDACSFSFQVQQTQPGQDSYWSLECESQYRCPWVANVGADRYVPARRRSYWTKFLWLSVGPRYSTQHLHYKSWRCELSKFSCLCRSEHDYLKQCHHNVLLKIYIHRLYHVCEIQITSWCLLISLLLTSQRYNGFMISWLLVDKSMGFN